MALAAESVQDLTQPVVYNATMWKDIASIDDFVNNASKIFYIPPERIVVLGLSDSSFNASVAFMSFYFVDAAASPLDRGELGVPSSAQYEDPNGYAASMLDYIMQNMDRADTSYLLNIVELAHNGSATPAPSSWEPTVWPPTSSSALVYMCVRSSHDTNHFLSLFAAALGLDSSDASRFVLETAATNLCPGLWTNISILVPNTLPTTAVAAVQSLSVYTSNSSVLLESALSALMHSNISQIHLNATGSTHAYDEIQIEMLSPIIATLSVPPTTAPENFALGVAASLNLSSPSQVCFVSSSLRELSFTIFSSSPSAKAATLALLDALLHQQEGSSNSGGDNDSGIGGFSPMMIISGTIMLVIVLAGAIVVVLFWKYGSVRSKIADIEEDYLVPLKQR